MVTYISAVVTPTVKGYWTGFRQRSRRVIEDFGMRKPQRMSRVATLAHLADVCFLDTDCRAILCRCGSLVIFQYGGG
jgi:hypothetical protein